MNTRNIIAGALAFGITSLALGQVIGKPEDQIRWRQSAYHTIAWSMGRIKTNVEDDFCAFSGQRPGRGKADAGSRTGDESALACQLKIHEYLCL